MDGDQGLLPLCHWMGFGGYDVAAPSLDWDGDRGPLPLCHWLGNDVVAAPSLDWDGDRGLLPLCHWLGIMAVPEYDICQD
jgi:hypothetical protein